MVAPTLLDCWHVRDLQRFRAVLKGGAQDRNAAPQPQSNTGGAAFSKSPLSHSHRDVTGPCLPAEVNRRDHYGRTVLHWIASCPEPWSIDYLNALLSHPSVNVNLQDDESGWTALHRALYVANLQAVLILLRRTDVDIRIRDWEGLAPFDLYNSTVAGTNPPADALAGESDPREYGRFHVRTLTQLFTWGSNRNYNLGLGDGDDRQLPDRVNLRSSASNDAPPPSAPRPAVVGKKFDRLGIKDVAISRLHTVVLTDEKVSNVWVCGVGGNGRMGRAPQIQSAFEPLKDFPETACSVAVAQDHTLVVTASGAVYSFGINRFSQLGYTIEPGLGQVGSTTSTFGQTAGKDIDYDIQISPRRVVGPLKREIVLGAACSKLHSAVFTSEGLYTWGTNTGQLGYDRSGTAIQVNPRKVTAIAAGAGIRQVAATEFGTACLLEGGDVFVWHNDTHFRVNFPLARFTSSMSVFRPRQVQPKTLISKLSSSGNTFSALSDIGDLFTFNLEHPSEYGSSTSGGTRGASGHAVGKNSAGQMLPKPQLLWSVRKKFSAVRDVAIGADGSVILCTESGHCFVRPGRGESGSKGGGGRKFKFQQIPYLQRVVKVATSESGALAAIKADPSLPELRVRGRSVEEALRDLLPHLKVQSVTEDVERQKGISSEVVEILDVQSDDGSQADSDEEDDLHEGLRRDSTSKYLRMALLIAEAAKRWTAGREVFDDEAAEVVVQQTATARDGPITAASEPVAPYPKSSTVGRRRAFYGPHNLAPPSGCDAFLIAGGLYLPVHRTILAARIPCLRSSLADPIGKPRAKPGVKINAVGADRRVTTISLSNCSFVASLFFLHYVYSDDLPPVWVPSLGMAIDRELKAAKIDRLRLQQELIAVAELLELPALLSSVRANVPRPPAPTLRDDMEAFFSSHVDVGESGQALFHDVVLRLKDRTVPAHSTILRRSPFFAALFQPHWTADRWDENNVITLDMSHLCWEVARIVLLHLYTDNGEALFRGCDADRRLEEYMDFLVEVMAASNELLLDKLKLVASSLLRKRVMSHTVGAVMTEADFYNADQLKDITMDYCTRSMETLLEGGMLNHLDANILRALTEFVRRRQDEKLRRTVASDRLTALIELHRDYYDDLDIPPPSLHLLADRVQPKKGSALSTLRSPTLTPHDSGGRRAGVRAALSPISSPPLRPVVGASIAMRTSSSGPGVESSEIFAMDEDDVAATPRRDSALRSGSTSSSPWASLPQVAHLSLDDPDDSSSTPSRAWRSRTVEAERRQTPISSSPALQPVTAPTDLRSIMTQEQQQQQQQNQPLPSATRFSNVSTPAGSGTSTPIHRSMASAIEISPLSVANTRLSQKERKRMQQQQQQEQEAATAAAAAKAQQTKARSGSVASPWKLPGPGSSPPDGNGASPWSLKAAGTTAMALGQSHEGTPPSLSAMAVRRPSAAPLQGTTVQRQAAGESPAGGSSAMGPTYTPSRMNSSTAPKRMASGSEAAWSVPTITPASGGSFSTAPFATRPSVASPSGISAARPVSQQPHRSAVTTTNVSSSPPAPAVSPSSVAQPTFAEIQEQQRMAIEVENERIRAAAASRRSFLDIQAEERKEEERKREEQKQAEEFEKWFAEESKRVQQEQSKASKGNGRSGKGGKGLKGSNSENAVAGGPSKQKGGRAKQQPAQQGNQSNGRPAANGKGGKDEPRSVQNSSGPNQTTPDRARGERDRGSTTSTGKGKARSNNGKPRPLGSTASQPNSASTSKTTAAAASASFSNSLPPKPQTQMQAPGMSAAAATFTPRQA
ncbi:hypothetical protein BCV70DRAFT_161852 [Testicularia cyperi]|uniref:BTB domain-containing protein n=1 Tax=Testicularia cyperi TaxID=1882483 RepID=A0A317XQY5_9BASI|nr:hypothetical protein BCV70DRAFT_161852 [Testicularia cyperi]